MTCIYVQKSRKDGLKIHLQDYKKDKIYKLFTHTLRLVETFI